MQLDGTRKKWVRMREDDVRHGINTTGQKEKKKWVRVTENDVETGINR